MTKEGYQCKMLSFRRKLERQHLLVWSLRFIKHFKRVIRILSPKNKSMFNPIEDGMSSYGKALRFNKSWSWKRPNMLNTSQLSFILVDVGEIR